MCRSDKAKQKKNGNDIIGIMYDYHSTFDATFNDLHLDFEEECAVEGSHQPRLYPRHSDIDDDDHTTSTTSSSADV